MDIKVSICMPYYERMKVLVQTLKGFKALGYFEEDAYEVVICDDGSVQEPLPEGGLIIGLQCKVVHLPKKEFAKNPCVALNAAVRASSGLFVLMQSPETSHNKAILEPMWKMAEHYKDVVLCPVREADTHRTRMKWRLHPVHQPKKEWWCQMMSRRFFDEVGGFNEDFRECSGGHEDDAFTVELDRRGARWHWLPEEYAASHAFLGRKKMDPKKATPGRKLFKELYPDVNLH